MTGSRPDALRSLESQLWTLGRRFRQRRLSLTQELAPELGVNGYAVLEQLARHGALRQSDLAEAVCTDKPAMSRLVHELGQLGLVERGPDPTDGRAQLVRLSDEGTRRMEAMLATRRSAYEERLSDWSVDDLERFARDLERYNHAWER